MPVHRRIAAVVWLGAFDKFARIHQAETEGNHGGPNRCDDAQPTVREEDEHLIDLRSVSKALTASCGNGIDVLFVRHQAIMGPLAHLHGRVPAGAGDRTALLHASRHVRAFGESRPVKRRSTGP
jgi:hypothetical protein